MRRRGLYLGVFYLNLFCSAASAAAFATKRSRRPVVAAENRRSLFFWRDDDSAVSNPQLNYRSSATILGESSSNNYNRNSRDAVPGGGSGSLVTQANVAAGRNQLLTAFTNLGLNDQYDAVLTGLCAKLLDSAATTTTILASSLVDCTDLLQEMNEQKIAASPRSLMALIDSTVKTQDATTMAAVMSQCSRNAGGIRQYGAQQTEIMLFPALPTTKVQCPDGKIKTRSERLANVAQIPTDDRTQEVASAAAFAVTVVSCELTNVLGMTDAQPVANTVLTLLIVVTVVDNFYDALRMGTQLAIRQFGGSGSSSSASTPVDLPLKENLPLGLGYGQWTGSVIRGWSRLSTFNVEREAQCEAAALYAAYVLGLPCFAFRPNALEASALLVAMKNDDDDNSNNNHRGPTSVGVLRMLIWLMAPVAMESMTHAQLIMSDPREAQAFLQRLEDYYSSLSWNKRDDTKMEDVLFWTESSETKADLLQWAFTEADLLLRSNKLILKELSDRLTSGAATIGDCVAVMEGW